MNSQELLFEDDISRNPYSVKSWWSYLDSKRSAKPALRFMLYERSLTFLPGSYKLWHAYLCDRVAQLETRCITDKSFTIAVNAFERSLVYMYKMPRIWLDYCTLLIRMKRGTDTRRAFDRALKSLPITQHKEIWNLFIEWATSFGVEESAVRVYKRFLMYDPSRREEFIDYLEEREQYEEAALQLSHCVNDENFISPNGKSKHDHWMRLCKICSNNPEHISDAVNVEEIIRGGISRFPDEVGKLWCRLADYYIRLGKFDRARIVYEEAINSVKTVRDFTIVFDACVRVEESLLTARMQAGDDEADIEASLARVEALIEKRPLQLNSVMLRQNPNNVFEWHKRIKLFNDEDKQKLGIFQDALQAIDPQNAVGRLSGIWMSLAKYHEKQNDIASARAVWKKAIDVNFKTVDELASVWCAWAEMEMHHENYEEALAIMERAICEPTSSVKRRKALAASQGKQLSQALRSDDNELENAPIADKLHKNVKVWSLYLDLEESLGTVETCRAAYDRVMDLKVVTAQMTLNYASFLEEHDFFEDSFRVYERAVSLFSFPHVRKIWLTYLDKFIARYEGSKIERLRDLFEQAVAMAPPGDAAEFYLKYAKAEEAYGLARHAMSIYDRATQVVPDANRLDMYRLYIKKIEQHFGVTKTRPAYERAISALNDDMTRDICLEFAEMERKLGELDRARAILQHGSQFADPRRQQVYWHKWREFEEAHGNEDTFRDMLRIQRSVETAFSQVNYAEVVGGGMFVPSSSVADPSGGLDIDDLAALAEIEAAERSATAQMAEGPTKRKFISASSTTADIDVQAAKIKKASEEINIDEDEVDTFQLATKAIPKAVFGNAAD